MKIDSHQHFWKVDRNDYHWMTPDIPVLHRDYLPEDLEPQLRKCGIDSTILVQAAQTEAETEWLLGLAESHDFIAGVIGWLDMDSPSFPDKLDRFCENSSFLGVRPMLQDLEDDAWIVRPWVLQNLSHLAERNVPFEFLTYTRHLPHVVTALEKSPGLHAVVDHLSKPEIKTGNLDPWRELMARVASFPNVSCKVSGMITEADWNHWRPEDLRPYVLHVLEVFGPERIMWGSDWPVCRCAGEYAEALNAARTILDERLTPTQQAQFYGGNAARFYGIRD
ncbi:MAG: amidohydrolase family protein [Candidatus Sumerlaeia bacterium]|nr:amidohydrolase family protein [Candidatus Sumerlaeia bacterium]